MASSSECKSAADGLFWEQADGGSSPSTPTASIGASQRTVSVPARSSCEPQATPLGVIVGVVAMVAWLAVNRALRGSNPHHTLMSSQHDRTCSRLLSDRLPVRARPKTLECSVGPLVWTADCQSVSRPVQSRYGALRVGAPVAQLTRTNSLLRPRSW